MQDSPVQARAAGRHQVVGPEWLLLSAVPRDIMTVRVCHRRGFKGEGGGKGAMAPKSTSRGMGFYWPYRVQ